MIARRDRGAPRPPGRPADRRARDARPCHATQGPIAGGRAAGPPADLRGPAPRVAATSREE